MDRNRIDSEYLIEAIKKHPSIWNKDSKMYQNKGFKENSWAKVGEELIGNWNNLSEDEKMIRLIDFKKRWSNIRDYYKKDVALQANGHIGTGSKRKKYIFSEELEFLKPFFINKPESEITCKNETEDGLPEEQQAQEAIYNSDSESSFQLIIDENKKDETRDWSASSSEKKIESGNLIDAIRKRECIWNKNLKNYHRKNRKEHSWNLVCEELMENWNSMNEDEKLNRKYELKKRWSNIRDYYKKDVALQLSGKIGQPSMKQQKYVYSKQLEFLVPFFDKSFTNEESQKEENEEIEPEMYLDPMYSSNSEHSLSLRPDNVHNSEETRTLEITPMVSVTDTESFPENDSDFLFLKSLVPDMKAMTREQKVDFKMGVLQLYKNIMSERRYFDNYDGSVDTKNPLQ